MDSGIQSEFWFLSGEILNQLSSNIQGSDRNKKWALLLDVRRFLGFKAKMGSSMPLPSLELGVHRQELGLQSGRYLSSGMEGHALPHLLQVRKLRGSLEKHMWASLLCLH